MKLNYLLLSLMYMSHTIMGQTNKTTTSSDAASNNTSTTTVAAMTTSSPSEPSSTTAPIIPGSATCTDQPVFDLCLKNQDNYINGCRQDEFACLCRWHTSKLSCYDNCPLNLGKDELAGTVKHICSQPGANITYPSQSFILPSSTALPSITGLAPSSSASNTSKNNSSAANHQIHYPNEIYLLSIVLFITGLIL